MYVDDDDFDEIGADSADEELDEDDAGRCDECGLAIKKDDAIVCPACTAMYHEWCASECNRCKTTLKADEAVEATGLKAGRRMAPKKRAAPKQRAR